MDNSGISTSADETISQLKNELDIWQLKYSILADCTDCGLWEYDIEKKFLHQSKKLSGVHENDNLDIPNFRETVIGWGIVHPEDLGIFEAYCDSMDRGDERFEYELRAVTDSKTFDWLRYTGVTVYDKDRKPVKVIGKTLNVTEEKKKILNLQRRADRDSLTNLFNKAHTKELVEEYITGKELEKKKHALLIIDIDDFKEVNDRFGHMCGDELLVKFSSALLSGFSQNDVVGRIGGDEFLVFITDIQSEQDVIDDIQRVVKRCKEFLYAEQEQITLSMGYALFPKDAKTYEALYKSADLALYQAKRQGKNRYRAYDKYAKYDASIGETKRKREEDGMGLQEQRGGHVQKGIFDYSFQVISSSTNIIDAAYQVFLEVGNYFHFDRIAFIEFDFASQRVNLIQSWVRDEKYRMSLEDLQTLVPKWGEIEKAYHRGGPFLIRGTRETTRRLLRESDAFCIDDKMQGMVQLPMMDGQQVVGFFTYEMIKPDRKWTEPDIAILSGTSRMICSSYLRFRSKSELQDEILYTGCAMDSQKLTYYAINSETYDVLYVSRYANELFPNIEVGKKCYQSVMGRNAPCDNCPIYGLKQGMSQYAQEIYSSKYDTWFTSSVSVIQKKGVPRQFLLCWTDITTFLERVMSTDQLTGTYSYDKFRAEALKKLADKKKKYSVAFFGIRDFSRINDEYGFHTGDIVIKAMANRIQDTLRENEIVCRVKGDDFIVLMEGCGAQGLIERVSHIFCTLNILLHEKYQGIQLNCMCGIYQIQSSDYSISRILDKANRAKTMAMNANADGDSIFLYTKEYEKQEDEEKQLERELIQAIRNEEFEVYIQPKVNLGDEKIGGAEALVRWIGADGKMISPGKFVPLAEKNGMVVDIDHIVYRKLFSFMREWLKEGKEVPTISINASRLHFNDDKFPGYLKELLTQYQIPSELVEVEVTESVFFGNMERMVSMIKKIRDLGVSISMDDFGTGYSTLSLMKSLPIDVLKVDGSFFMRSELDEKNRAVISAIIHLAKSLGMDVVCEGIETKEQVEFVKEQKGDMAQGFYYYKPMPALEFYALLEDKEEGHT